MPRSMTGFGRGEAKSSQGKVIVEIKTLNHRHFDIAFRLPNHFSLLEAKIRECIHRNIYRGRVNVSILYEGTKQPIENLSIDKNVAISYHRLLSQLKRQLRLTDQVRLEQIAAFPNVITYERASEDIDKLWLVVKKALIKALNKLKITRKAEGRNLTRDLRKRIGIIEKDMERIKERADSVVERHKARLDAKVKNILAGPELDKNRLATEVAIFAEHSDITEETVRASSHLAAFKKKLLIGGEIGRTLEFIIQELHREVNTISAKASDYTISKNVIAIKGELEKIREQVQNIE